MELEGAFRGAVEDALQHRLGAAGERPPRRGHDERAGGPTGRVQPLASAAALTPSDTPVDRSRWESERSRVLNYACAPGGGEMETDPTNPGEPASTVLAHDYLLVMRGAERVFAAMAEMYPGAPILTLLYDERGDRAGASPGHGVTASPLQRLGVSQDGLPAPAAPVSARRPSRLRVPACELLLSSSSAFAHGLHAPRGRRARLLLPRPVPLRLVRAGARARGGAARRCARRCEPCCALDAPLGPRGERARRPLRRQLRASRGAHRALLRPRGGRSSTRPSRPSASRSASRATSCWSSPSSSATSALARRARGGAPRRRADPGRGLGPRPRRAARPPSRRRSSSAASRTSELAAAVRRRPRRDRAEQGGVRDHRGRGPGGRAARDRGRRRRGARDGARRRDRAPRRARRRRGVPRGDRDARGAARSIPRTPSRNAERFSVAAFRRGLSEQVQRALADGTFAPRRGSGLAVGSAQRWPARLCT